MTDLDSFRGHQLVPHSYSPHAGTRGAYRCSHLGCDHHVVIVDGAPEGTVQVRADVGNASIVGPQTANDLGALSEDERKKIPFCPIGANRGMPDLNSR